MASEIRVDKINSLSGVGTVTLSPTGVDIAGITTAATLRATTGIVTSLTAGSLTSLGAVSGTTGTFTGNVDINGNELILDADADTSITADTDDQIDLKLSGSDRMSIKASGSTSVDLNTGGSMKLTVGDSDSHQFINGSDEAMRIDSSGRLLLGTTSTSGISAGGDDIIIGSIGDSTSRGITFATTADATIRWADAGDNAMGRIQYLNSTDVMTFHTSNAQRLRLDSDGMKFGSDSAAANALDDYEEGTFTPSSNATLSSAAGSYTKIGRQVTVHIRIQTASSSSGTQMNIGNMPFTADMPSGLSNGSVPNGFGYISGSVYNGGVQLHMEGNGTNCYFFNFGTTLSITNLASRDMRFGLVYTAA